MSAPDELTGSATPRAMRESDAQTVRDAASSAAGHADRGQSPPDPWSDERTIAAMRVVLAASALIVSLFAHPGPQSFARLIFVFLLLYGVYSAVLLWIVRRRTSRVLPGTHWIDVGWYTAFTAFGGGTTSPFFSFYYFAILVASFRGGFTSGVRVTLASAVLFSIVGYLVVPEDAPWLRERLLLRPIFLLVIGFLMAGWGNLEILEKRRLVLLKEISGLANPRFGEGETVASILEKVRAFHDADAAILIVADSTSCSYAVRRCDRRSPRAARQLSLDSEAGALLTTVPWTHAVTVNDDKTLTIDLECDSATREDVRAGDQARPYAALSSLLECRSFVSVPFRYDSGAMARVYATSASPRAFGTTDAEFLLLVFAHVMPAVERLRLLDRLALEAAAHERERLARNLHDSVIQPYIGLQMGISAALEHARQQHDVVPILERLLHATQREIGGLRHYASDLNNERETSGGFLAGVRRITTRLTEATNIRVDVEAPDHLVVPDRLAAEVFQMIAEGVSNIRRHTTANHALVRLERRHERLCFRIENPGEPGTAFRPFVPRSLSERASALGGTSRVFGRPDGGAVVDVEIPV